MAPGAWAGTGRMCIFDVNSSYVLFFVPYGVLVSFAVIRVISALFLKQTMAAAAVDPEQAMAEKEKKKNREMAHLRTIFEDADADGGGSLTEEEFVEVLTNPRVRTILSLMEIDTADAKSLFHVLDNGDGHLFMEEMVPALARIRGFAKSCDVIKLMYASEHIQMQLNEIQKLVANGAHGRTVGATAFAASTP